jgi:RNA polymerase sigma-70 factor (ECF subfamily)
VLSTETPVSDRELLLRAQGGDRPAFDLFLSRHASRVLAWMQRATGREDAEDLAQDVFFRAFRGLAQFRGDAPPLAWLAAIAHNVVKNRYRFLARFRRVFLPADPGADPPGEALDPEENVTLRQRESLLRRAIERLPQDFRMPLALRDLEGWNYEEIAVSLHLPVGTVKSRIARARGRLRDLLAPDLKR